MSKIDIKDTQGSIIISMILYIAIFVFIFLLTSCTVTIKDGDKLTDELGNEVIPETVWYVDQKSSIDNVAFTDYAKYTAKVATDRAPGQSAIAFYFTAKRDAFEVGDSIVMRLYGQNYMELSGNLGYKETYGLRTIIKRDTVYVREGTTIGPGVSVPKKKSITDWEY